jgi:predicted nucleic acid-binding protein
MKAFFDTSVLVPIFYGAHEHHHDSMRLFLEADKRKACCGAHSLAELYSTVTRMPGRISGNEAMLLIPEVRKRLSVITLDADEYVSTLEKSAALGISGGSVYDALLAACAIKAKAETIYSWNTRHYTLCGSDVTARLRRP